MPNHLLSVLRRNGAIAVTVVLLASFAVVDGAKARADAPAAAPTPAPSLVLPLERTRYFVGETVLIAATDTAGSHRIAVASAAAPLTATPSAAGHIWALDTSRLAPGTYQLLLDGKPSGTEVEIVSPVRPSPAAIGDEILPSPQTDAAHATVRQTLAATGINAILGVNNYGTSEGDDFAATRTMYWLNPYTRPISFYGARVYEPEVRQFRQRLAQIAQENDKYPTFGGMQYEWDPGSMLDRSGLLFYWGWNGQDQALRNYNDRSTAAIYSEFTRRTGLTAPTTAEFIRYVASIGHPEFGPAFDLPTYRWINEISKNVKPMAPEDKVAFEKRLSAWTEYLSGIYGETYTGHQQELKRIDPSLASTASIDMQAYVREGHWQERAYAPLDFRFIEAWDDQTSVPNYPYQWLITAALADMGRKQDQPVWVASSLGTVFGQANYAGKLMRVTGHDLAYGGRGVGFALEGFSNILGGMNGDTNWPKIEGKAGAADLLAARQFLNRFAPLQAQSTDVRKVGVLLSLTQNSRQQAIAGLFTPPGRMFLTLARLGYTPRFISEEDITGSRTAGLRDLVIVNQTAELPAAVMKHIAALQAAGTRVFVDDASTIKIPGALHMDVKLPFKEVGRPFNWGVVNTQPMPPQVQVDRVHAQIAPAVLAALGDADRPPLIASSGAATKASLFEIDGGADARYVVAVDDALGDNAAAWQRLTETLVPNHASGMLYDVTDEKPVGTLDAVKTVPCEFNNVTARVYAILARPVTNIRLAATQSLETGRPATVRVEFTGADGKLIAAAIPFSITATGPDGTTHRFDRATNATGTFTGSFPLNSDGVPGAYRLTAHCRLNGLDVSLPVNVRQAAPVTPGVVNDAVIVRGTTAIQALLHSAPRFAVPVFDGPSQPALAAAAGKLRSVLSGMNVSADVLLSPAQTTYLMGYDPTAAELAENARAERGEAIGKIKVTTVNGNDYFATETGYVYGRPVILLDLASGQEPAQNVAGAATPTNNPMATALNGLLWPRVTSTFPGPGKAVVQIVRSAFWLGVDAIVIQATDAAGLNAGVNALAHLPADKLTTGVEGARSVLLHQLSIGPALPVQQDLKLTSNGLTSGASSPEPLVIDLSTGPTPPDAATAAQWQPPAPTTHTLPLTLKPSDMTQYFAPAGQMVEAWNPGGQFAGDLRFLDAEAVTVDAGAGGPVHVTIDGKFRYSDRVPRSQSTWEDLIALYTKIVPQVRRPVTADVFVDGKLVGTLSDVKTAEIDAIIDTPGGGSTANAKTSHEEAVTQISGTVTLPAGVHTVMIESHNTVDGQIDQITIAP